MTAWQPISTAPKDGKPLLLFLDPPLDTNLAVGWMSVGELDIGGWLVVWFQARR
jgi:hypothetical protein